MIIGEPFIDYSAHPSNENDFDSFVRRNRRANQGNGRRRPLRSLVKNIKTNLKVRKQNRINNFGLIRQNHVVEVRDEDVPENVSVAQQQPVQSGTSDAPQAIPDTTTIPIVNDAGVLPNAEKQTYYSYNRRPKKSKRKKSAAANSTEVDKTTEEKKPTEKNEAGEPKEKEGRKDAAAPSGGGDKKSGIVSDPAKGKEENKAEEKVETKTGTTDTMEKNAKQGNDTLGLVMGLGCLLLTAGIAIYAASVVTNVKRDILSQHIPRT